MYEIHLTVVIVPLYGPKIIINVFAKFLWVDKYIFKRKLCKTHLKQISC